MQETNARQEAPGEEARDFRVDGGCVVCGGPIDVRVLPGSVRACCAPCGWISRPLLWQSSGQVAIAHPPLAAA